MLKIFQDTGTASHRDFSGKTFELLDFSHYDFSSTNLSEATFIACQFYDEDRSKGCSFRNGMLRETQFLSCNLSLTDFSYSDVFGAEFLHCKLSGASFENARFENYITRKKWFCSGKIEGCNLSNAILAGIIMENCILKGNRWHETDIQKAVFRGADLSGGEFSGIQWTDADFTYSDLRGATLQGLDLRKVNLTGVKMEAWQISSLIANLGIIIS
ncbi:pentapeptide repeat-containing protein [Xenorhabdus sp. IM139775]|uniref:pentapeptide repeat-containing protein n=1 Tax=Xenorhabdus sp. IM139775 TaxID=3025876 RepID=UPI00235826DC|nr:pentapeptide repeat-containing protein [Xenorhabdus sp. IM139775]MDC9594765.1 pentapeptide repeat-containing protein [Xenorhabdus sp. IM139775]